MSRQILSKEETVNLKRERIPVHESRNKFSARGLDTDTYYYRFVDINNKDRVTALIEAGYEFVTKAQGVRLADAPDSAEGISSLVTINGGRGALLALVCTPWEFKNQDDAAQEKRLLDQERDQRRQLAALSDPNLGNIGPGIQEFGAKISIDPIRTADK